MDTRSGTGQRVGSVLARPSAASPPHRRRPSFPVSHEAEWSLQYRIPGVWMCREGGMGCNSLADMAASGLAVAVLGLHCPIEPKQTELKLEPESADALQQPTKLKPHPDVRARDTPSS